MRMTGSGKTAAHMTVLHQSNAILSSEASFGNNFAEFVLLSSQSFLRTLMSAIFLSMKFLKRITAPHTVLKRKPRPANKMQK